MCSLKLGWKANKQTKTNTYFMLILKSEATKWFVPPPPTPLTCLPTFGLQRHCVRLAAYGFPIFNILFYLKHSLPYIFNHYKMVNFLDTLDFCLDLSRASLKPDMFSRLMYSQKSVNMTWHVYMCWSFLLKSANRCALPVVLQWWVQCVMTVRIDLGRATNLTSREWHGDFFTVPSLRFMIGVET